MPACFAILASRRSPIWSAPGKRRSRIENGHEGARLDTLFSILAALDLDLQLGPRGKGRDIGEIF
jgi:HTH-type transcriptional regulator/antitoxin HipB